MKTFFLYVTNSLAVWKLDRSMYAVRILCYTYPWIMFSHRMHWFPYKKCIWWYEFLFPYVFVYQVPMISITQKTFITYFKSMKLLSMRIFINCWIFVLFYMYSKRAKTRYSSTFCILNGNQLLLKFFCSTKCWTIAESFRKCIIWDTVIYLKHAHLYWRCQFSIIKQYAFSS